MLARCYSGRGLLKCMAMAKSPAARARVLGRSTPAAPLAGLHRCTTTLAARIGSRRRKQGGIPTAAVEAAAALQLPAVLLSFSLRPQLYDRQGRLMLKNLTLEELEEWCASIGEGPRRAKHLWQLMYQQNKWIRSFADGPDSHRLAAAAQAKLGAVASLSGGLTLQSVHTARDGTHKLVFALNTDEGEAAGSVETVLIPMTNRDGSQPRYTACLSTQVGCAMNCQFCFTGRMGLLGNLSTAQVVEQVVEARRWLASLQQQQQQQPQQREEEHQQLLQELEQQPRAASPSSSSYEEEPAGPSSSSSTSSSSRRGQRGKWPAAPPRISNIVFMGMGEPLHNMDAVMPALDILADPQGLALSKAKIIVSTVGLVPQLRQLRESGKAKLAVSLHATTDEIRSWIVPTNRKYSLELLMGTLAELYPLGHPELKRDDFVVLEYVLLKGVNDSEEDAKRLLQLTEKIYCMVNLIVFNPHEGTQFQRSEDEQVAAFRRILIEGGKVCTVRLSKGDDEMAACGQLGDPGLSPRLAPILKPPQRLRTAVAG